MGARVIKVERAEGDFARGYDRAAHGESSYFVWNNRGKESLVLDFKNESDAALLRRILAHADVFVQNLAPGAAARAGFDSTLLREQHPRLITCDISGYGSDGSASDLKAYDLLVQCESGLAAVSGSPDSYGRIGVSICDIGAGMNATIGVLSALALRERTGRGSGVEISLFHSAADWMTVPYLHEIYGEGAPTRQGLQHPSIAPYGAFRTAGGDDIVISIQNEREWQQFCEHFLLEPGLGTEPMYRSNSERVKNRKSLDARIAVAFAAKTTGEALEALSAARTAFGRVRTVKDFAEHPALRTWPMMVEGRELRLIAPPVRAPWDDGQFLPVPSIGQHDAALRAEFRKPD
jgi:crotonobetainyl-CoA:carnitine CoA-transferase CaiB-like acyl-CoA transferase